MIAALSAVLLAVQVASGPPREELQAKAERAKQAMAAGRFDDAAALYRDLVRALPGEPGMLMNLGIAEAMAGRPREAVPHLRAATKLRPELSPAWLFLGAAHLELDEPARALEPLRKVLAGEPANREARRMLGDALLSLERFREAADQFRALSDGADSRALYGLGRSYEGMARSSFAELQRSAPDSVFMLLLTAQAMSKQGKDANAYRLYREALDREPGLAEARESVAAIYEKTGHADWAAIERERAAAAPALDCGKRPALECDYRAGRYEAVLTAASSLRTAEARYWSARAGHELALAAFRKLGELPPSPEAALVRAEILGAQGRHAEAAAGLREASRSWPRDWRLARELASALYLGRDFEAAGTLLETLVEHEPGSAQLAYLLGDTYLQLRQADKAIPALESAVTRDPGLLPARAALGRAYMETDRAALALPHLEAAAAEDEDGGLHYQLARAYQSAGRADKAATALATYQRLRAEADSRARGLEQEFRITPPRQ